MPTLQNGWNILLTAWQLLLIPYTNRQKRTKNQKDKTKALRELDLKAASDFRIV